MAVPARGLEKRDCPAEGLQTGNSHRERMLTFELAPMLADLHASLVACTTSVNHSWRPSLTPRPQCPQHVGAWQIDAKVGIKEDVPWLTQVRPTSQKLHLFSMTCQPIRNQRRPSNTKYAAARGPTRPLPAFGRDRKLGSIHAC